MSSRTPEQNARRRELRALRRAQDPEGYRLAQRRENLRTRFGISVDRDALTRAAKYLKGGDHAVV